jgi:3-oxoacyl-[acyl-carrier-protein] synthase-1
MNALAITGIGAVTPVGLSAPASAAAFRASVARLTSLQAGVEQGPEGAVPPRRGGRVPLEWFDGGPKDEKWPGHERFEVPLPPPEYLLIENGAERLVRLAAPAAVESVHCALRNSVAPANWGLFLGLSTHEEAGTGQQLTGAINAALGGFRPALAEVVAHGRAAGLAALSRAASAITDGKIAGAIVGGVDSLVRPAVYGNLESAGILKGPANEYGVFPGEAAAFCILEKQPVRGKAMASLTATATGEEPTAGTEKPNQAQALTAVLRAMRTSAAFSDLPLFICDLNGDRYRALEWGLAYSRVFGGLHEKPNVPTSGDFWHPADCIGDCGAASGLVDLVWAVEALRKKYAIVNQVLVWGASDSALRAAVLLASQN